MKHTFGKRPVSRVLFGLVAGALVVSACGSGSSPASEDTTSDTVSSDTSAPRERNAMVGGFGTDGSGFIDIPLAGLTSRIRSNLTLTATAMAVRILLFMRAAPLKVNPSTLWCRLGC